MPDIELVIKIPEEEYKNAKQINWANLRPEQVDNWDWIIAHGKPLERIIGTEILKAKQNITIGKKDYNMGIYVGLIKALNLFEDKGSESE